MVAAWTCGGGVISPNAKLALQRAAMGEIQREYKPWKSTDGGLNWQLVGEYRRFRGSIQLTEKY